MKKEELFTIDYSNTPKVLEVKDLRISFKTDSGLVHAVRGVSFDLYKGETLCIVGESGSGKSVTNKAIMGISAANAIIESGQIMYNGEDLTRVSEEEFHRIRGHKIGMIFQDPLSSLNPIMKVGKQITEATLINRNILKRRYNELISNELVAFRNEEANLAFEIKKAKDEIVFLNKLKKELINSKKISKKDDGEMYNESVNKVKEYYDNLIASNETSIRGIDEEIASLSKKEEDFTIAINNSIRDLRIEFLNQKKEKIILISDKEFKDNVLIQFINVRIEEIKDYIKLIKTQHKAIKPLYKKALSKSKKIAKSDNELYAKKLKENKDKEVAILKKQLEEVINKINVELPILSDEEKANYLLILKQNHPKSSLFSKFFKKQDVTTGIQKASQKEIIIEKTGNESFDKLLKLKEELELKLEKTEEDYINATKITKKEAKKIALNVMKEVGIPLPEQRFKQYPFEFSGGMRQRIVIAIALTANPDILICDEPTTALDVTIQAQILELINRLKKERNLSCIFITHDLGVVANMADRVAVMYAGKIVEYGTSYEVFFEPKHPYTWALLSSIPDIDSKEKLESIPGTPPDMRFPPKGDAFALRSKYALKIDFENEPPYFEISKTHYAATWLLHEDAPKVEMPQIVKTRIENALKGANIDE